MTSANKKISDAKIIMEESKPITTYSISRHDLQVQKGHWKKLQQSLQILQVPLSHSLCVASTGQLIIFIM